MKKRIGLLVLAASLMVSQTALAGKWTGTVPTQTRADWAAEYDTPTVGRRRHVSRQICWISRMETR